MSMNDFEKNMLRLEEIVALLEAGECTLDESMALFEEGIKLASLCGKKIEDAKQKLITLTQKENGE